MNLQKPPKRAKKAPKPIKRSRITKRGRPSLSPLRRTPKAKESHAADLRWAKAVRESGPCAASWHVISDFEGVMNIHGKCWGQKEAAHIVSRRFSATRTDLDNGLPLCHWVHSFFTKRPIAWEAFLLKTIGAEKLESLKAKAMAGVKSLDKP